MLIGTNLTYTKAYNYRIVFETIRLHGSISRADIARKSNLTAQTVSNIVTRLLDKQIIQEGRKRQKDRGAPSVALEINPEGAYSIGLDLNRDHLTGILVDLNGEVKTKMFYEIDSPTPEQAIELMVYTIHQLLESHEIDDSKFCGVGIGLPGPIEINGDDIINGSVHPKAFPNWSHVPIVKLLAKHINTPIYLENNASAATIGERWYGAGKNISNFLYTFFGVGLGGGLVLNGNLFEGFNHNAGELGYFPFFSDLSPLSNSPKPHIGEHFNLSRLYEWLKEYDVFVSRPEDLNDLFFSGQPQFKEWLALGKRLLLPVFIAVEYVFDPEVIILGGRLPQPIIKDMCDDLPRLLAEIRIPEKSYAPKFKCATAGIDAAALGAATLPMFNLFAAQPGVLIKNSQQLSSFEDMAPLFSG